MALDSHLYRDPMLIVQERQERERKNVSAKRERAESLFRGDDEMGRKLELPGRVTSALFQWGEWANRPNFWVDLRITPFCKLMGMDGHRDAPTIRLDPQSQRVHRAVLALHCDKTKAVLFAYYVMNFGWADKASLFTRIGIGRDTFYRLLRTGSLMAYSASHIDKSEQK